MKIKNKYDFAYIVSISIFFLLLESKILSASKMYYMPSSTFIGFVRHKNLRILLVSSWEHLGERQSSIRMSEVLRSLGYFPICLYSDCLASVISDIFDIDIYIDFNPEVNHLRNFYNFAVCSCLLNDNMSSYNAILSVVPISNLMKVINKIPIVQFYHSVPATEFDDRPKTALFYCGDLWDSYRSFDLIKLYKMLDRTNYCNVYGTSKWLEFGITNSYRGFIPLKETAVLDVMREKGISLILHSEEHFKNNAPTSRIFEATAASNVIITDRLPFIVENFGDSVLYIDRYASPEVLFKQIDTHMKWILSHPKEAIELARYSHKIFVEKFTLERIMKNIMEFYIRRLGFI